VHALTSSKLTISQFNRLLQPYFQQLVGAGFKPAYQSPCEAEA